MSKNDQPAQTPKTSWTAYLLAAALAALAGFFAVYVNFASEGNRNAETSLTPAPPPATSSSGPLAGLSRGDMATFLVHAAPKDLPPFEFSNGAGERISLKNWRGKVVLVNFWATWCLPCLKEMPALDALKGEIGDQAFDVVAISVDRGGIEKPRKFLKKIAAERLALYHDGSGRLNSRLRILGMPTSILVDAQGREIGRLVGPAEWDSQDAVRLMRAALDAYGAGS